ncbi:T9SS type A sorting domain-containing protein [Polaribacter vadi]
MTENSKSNIQLIGFSAGTYFLRIENKSKNTSRVKKLIIK